MLHAQMRVMQAADVAYTRQLQPRALICTIYFHILNGLSGCQVSETRGKKKKTFCKCYKR